MGAFFQLIISNEKEDANNRTILKKGYKIAMNNHIAEFYQSKRISIYR
jgi:hypothetical protein